MTGLPVRPPEQGGRRRRGDVDVDQYMRMAAAGVFAPDERLELIDGEILTMSPIGDPHYACVTWLNYTFVPLAAADRAFVQVQLPVQMGDRSMPEPDVALLPYRADFYGSPRPQGNDVLLAVEVAESSLRFDRERKRPLYAAAGVPEMWIVDLVGCVVDIATGPSPHGYDRIVQAGPGDTIAPSAFPDLLVDLAQLCKILPRR